MHIIVSEIRMYLNVSIPISTFYSVQWNSTATPCTLPQVHTPDGHYQGCGVHRVTACMVVHCTFIDSEKKGFVHMYMAHQSMEVLHSPGHATVVAHRKKYKQRMVILCTW